MSMGGTFFDIMYGGLLSSFSRMKRYRIDPGVPGVDPALLCSLKILVFLNIFTLKLISQHIKGVVSPGVSWHPLSIKWPLETKLNKDNYFSWCQ